MRSGEVSLLDREHILLPTEHYTGATAYFTSCAKVLDGRCGELRVIKERLSPFDRWKRKSG